MSKIVIEISKHPGFEVLSLDIGEGHIVSLQCHSTGAGCYISIHGESGEFQPFIDAGLASEHQAKEEAPK